MTTSMRHVPFAVYETGSGEIVVNGFGPEEYISSYCGPGREFIVGSYSAAEYYVKNGEPVRFPEKPDPRCQSFDFMRQEWVAPPSLSEERLESARRHRGALLVASDWTQMPDSPLNPEIKHQWALYRQALRDITLQPDPVNIVWPTPPT